MSPNFSGIEQWQWCAHYTAWNRKRGWSQHNKHCIHLYVLPSNIVMHFIHTKFDRFLFRHLWYVGVRSAREHLMNEPNTFSLLVRNRSVYYYTLCERKRIHTHTGCPVGGDQPRKFSFASDRWIKSSPAIFRIQLYLQRWHFDVRQGEGTKGLCDAEHPPWQVVLSRLFLGWLIFGTNIRFAS